MRFLCQGVYLQKGCQNGDLEKKKFGIFFAKAQLAPGYHTPFSDFLVPFLHIAIVMPSVSRAIVCDPTCDRFPSIDGIRGECR